MLLKPWLLASSSSAWQRAQVSATLPAETLDAASAEPPIVCSSWQSVHTGTSSPPDRKSAPWTPAR